MPPRPSNAMMRYRPATSMPGTKRPCSCEEGDEGREGGTTRCRDPPKDGEGTAMVGASARVAGSAPFSCRAPHCAQKGPATFISDPHESQHCIERFPGRYGYIT